MVCAGLSALAYACGSAGDGTSLVDAGAAASGGTVWAGSGGSPGGGAAAGGAPSTGGIGGAPATGGFGGNPAEDAGTDAPSGAPATIRALSGNGAALLENWPGGTLKVRIEDSAGAPVSNATITWSVVSGEGANLTSPGQPTDVTDSNGIAARMLQGAGFSASKPYGETVLRASSSVGSVDFVAITVHQTNIGPIGPLIALTEPASFDLGDVKAGSTLPGAAKLQVVVQAGVFSGTPLPKVALRFVNPSNKDEDGVVNCAGGAAFTNAAGLASCDLVVGTQLGQHDIAAFGGESTIFSAIHLNIVP